MEKDIATLLDAAAFQAAHMVGPAIVLEGAGRHLLDRLDLNDPHRFAVISAVGSITAARKSLESAAEELLAVVAQDGADMLAVEVHNGEIVKACSTFKPMIYDDPDVCFDCGERQAAH
ncbi:hypothetical protein [Rhodococcoides fascians]|uniref:hypothetical protein n=1 Tax=Rhodococcoides fascians TaxID=1828 RepID=UPI00055E80F9|nr:hypothetical protein [Rhodococcus fascians]